MDFDYDYLGQVIRNAIADGMRDGFEATEKPIGLRDFFAGCALIGLISNDCPTSFSDGVTRHQYCFVEADSMLIAKAGKTPHDEPPHA